jgi:hypothetical protein
MKRYHGNFRRVSFQNVQVDVYIRPIAGRDSTHVCVDDEKARPCVPYPYAHLRRLVVYRVVSKNATTVLTWPNSETNEMPR